MANVSNVTWFLVLLTYPVMNPALASEIDESNKQQSFLANKTFAHESPWVRGLKQRIWQSWVELEKLNGTKIRMQMSVADDGKIYDVKVVRDPEDYKRQTIQERQIEADLLQSIMGAACYAPRTDSNKGVLLHMVIDFDEKKNHKKSQLLQNLKSTHELKNGEIAYFAIPIDVLQRYPGAFSDEELISPKNTICRIGTQRIRSWYAEWSVFFQENPSATREQLLEHAKSKGFEFEKGSRTEVRLPRSINLVSF